MLASFQLLAQGIFETIESHIKMYLLRREAEKEGLDVNAALGGSSFDGLDPIAEAEQEAIADEEKPKKQPPRFADLRNLKSYQKYKMSMGFNKVHEIGVEKRAYSRLSMSMRRPSTATPKSGGFSASRRYTSNFEDYQDSMNILKHSSTMVRLNTGLANEEVPENAEHFLVPAWIRFVSRTLYVLIATGLGICLPNFTAFISFLGAFKCVIIASLFFFPKTALTIIMSFDIHLVAFMHCSFFLLSVMWPTLMYLKVFAPGRIVAVLLKVLIVTIFLTSLSASIGAFRDMVLTWINDL